MTNISTGVYSIGPLSKVSLSEDAHSAIATLTHISLAKATILKKLYYHSKHLMIKGKGIVQFAVLFLMDVKVWPSTNIYFDSSFCSNQTI